MSVDDLCERGEHDDESVLIASEGGASLRRTCRTCGRIERISASELAGRTPPPSRRA
ncbi:hypothetical protein [Janibacter melonis]|uniref:hypothetical protein n=1 Tax=Janibacter melonis TaxID=262209 RepID=UPI0017480D58|nr:hypothetical protein [Janibacter melonis]